MALRASKSASVSSLLSKFKQSASTVTAFNDSKMANDYANGLITGAEYLGYLNGRANGMSKNTSSYITISKRIKSVKSDIEQNDLQTRVDLGVEDPAKLAEVISRRVVEEGILEGTPEYNQILKTVVNLRDQSVNYEKKKKRQEYEEMKKIDPSQADKMWDDYLGTLPDRMSNQIAVENAQNEAQNFHMNRIKSEIARAIQATSVELKQNGVEGSAFHAAMRDAYSEAAQIANDNGLVDYANTLDNYAFTSNQNYANAAESEMKSASAADRKLAEAKEWDIRTQIELAKKSGDIDLMQSLNKELEGNINLQIELNKNAGNEEKVAMLSKDLLPISEEATALENTFQVGTDGKILPRMLTNKDGAPILGENGQQARNNPLVGDYVLVQGPDGNVTRRKVAKINDDNTFETDGWKADNKQMVVDPRTGFLVDVLEKDRKVINPMTGEEVVDKGNPIRYVQIPGQKDGIMVGKDKKGDNMLLGEEVSPGIYRMPKADGGYDYSTYDGKTAEKIDALKASEIAQKPIKDMLKGSTSKRDQEIVSKFGDRVFSKEIGTLLGIKDGLQSLRPDNTAVKTVETLVEKPPVNIPEEKTPITGSGGGGWGDSPGPTVTPGNVGTYVAPTELIAPKPTNTRPAAGQPVNPANFAELGRVDTIAPGYTRKRKADGGFDYFKGNSSISVDDLARETKTVKSKLLDPNAKKFTLI